MGALCLLPSAPPSCSCSAAHSRPPKLVATPFPSSTAASGARLRLAGRRRRRAGVARGGSGGKGEVGKNGAAAFFGEDGVVEDMDGYLKYMSLEYDSVWDTKPSWCQPWTILLSGTIAVAFSWVLIHSIVITAGVSFVICAWWYIFLYSYPKNFLNSCGRRDRLAALLELGAADDVCGLKEAHAAGEADELVTPQGNPCHIGN